MTTMEPSDAPPEMTTDEAVARPVSDGPAGITRHVLIVANPTSGGFRSARIEALSAALDRVGIRVQVRLTRHAGELVEIAASLPDGIDTLVVGGGDGSVNEAVSGLVQRTGPMPALAILPSGTANVLACELGLPSRTSAVVSSLVERRTVPLHLGRIGDRPFILMVSAGFDAAVVHAIDPRVKRRWGKLAYAATAIRLALSGENRDVTLEADGEPVTARIAIVTTARCYGGPMTITRATGVTRPGLRLVTLADDRPWTLARAAVALALGRLDRLAAVDDRAVGRVRFTGATVPMQLDGDAIATSCDIVEAHPRTLPIIVPGAGVR